MTGPVYVEALPTKSFPDLKYFPTIGSSANAPIPFKTALLFGSFGPFA
jgi:hypothetical protein